MKYLHVCIILLLSLTTALSFQLTKQQKKALKTMISNEKDLKKKLLENPDFQNMIKTYTSCKKPNIRELFQLEEKHERKEMKDHPLVGATTPEIIMYYGYPVETHYLTTEDGYNLELHRIACPREGCVEGEIREAVIIQHGILCSSSDWVVNPPHQALGFLLVEAGYDVWLPNFRGNTYSKSHESLDPRDEEFWQFTWDEHGEFDLPAIIDYVLYRTGFDKLYYIGHSMGTTSFFVLAHKRPEYNDKVEAFFAMAPVATLDNMGSPMRLLAPFVNIIEWIVVDLLNIHQFLPGGPFMDWVAKTFCDDDDFTQFICSNIMFLLCGYNQKQLNETMLPVYISTTPAGTSTKTMLHYTQSVNSAAFRDYDYGEKENIEIYGNTVPPSYDLSKVIVPTYVYWGENDWMTDPVDVMELSAELGNLRLLYRVDDDRYNHLDFMWGIGSRTLLYDPIINEMLNMKLPFSKDTHNKPNIPHNVIYHNKHLLNKNTKKMS